MDRIEELKRERIIELDEKTKEIYNSDEMLNFLNDFESLSPQEQFNKWAEKHNYKNKTEKDKGNLYTATAILINRYKLIGLLKEKKIKLLGAWDDIDVVLDVAKQFDVHPAVARYRLLCVAKVLNKQNQDEFIK